MKSFSIITFFVLFATLVYAQGSVDRVGDVHRCTGLNSFNYHQTQYLQRDTLNTQPNTQQTLIENSQKTIFNWMCVLFFWNLILTICILICLFRKKAKNNIVLNYDDWEKEEDRRNEVVGIICGTSWKPGSYRINDWLKKRINEEISPILEKLDKLPEAVGEGYVINDDSVTQHINTPEQETSTPSADKTHSLKSKKLYALSINNGKFVIITGNHTEDAIFELSINDDGQTASVTICNRAYSKVLADPGAYLRGCDKNVWGDSQVNIVEKGIARQSEDGKWMVEKKLKVDLK